MKSLLFGMCGLLLVVMVGCGKESAQTSVPAEPLPANLFTATEPPGAVDVATAKKSAQDGQTIVIKGRIGGQKEPLALNRAIMTLADLSLPTCDKTPMADCKTPWDSCCQPPDELAAKTISVQVVGPDGRPIKAGLKGVKGIAPLKQVVVMGTVRTTPGSDALVVEAKQIYMIP